MTLQRHQPSIPLLTQDTFTAVTLPDHVDIVIRNDRWLLDLAAREPKHTDLGKRLARSPPLIAAIHRDWGDAPGNFHEFRFFAGLRPSQEIALTVGDFDEARRTLSVTKARVPCGLEAPAGSLSRSQGAPPDRAPPALLQGTAATKRWLGYK
jgi:hypothetical protein